MYGYIPWSCEIFKNKCYTYPVDCFSLVIWYIFISILICASLCRDMYPMIYTYPDFRVLGFLGLKDMHMHLELFQVFLGSHWPKYTKWQQNGTPSTIFFFVWSLSLIVWWWSSTMLSVALGCFTFDFLHFSLHKYEFLLLLFLWMLCELLVNARALVFLFFFFWLANGSKISIFCAMSYLLCVALLSNLKFWANLENYQLFNTYNKLGKYHFNF